MKLIKNISFYIILGFLLTLLSWGLESQYLYKFLKENIVSLLITILAINIATLGLITSRIQDILNKYDVDFKDTTKEMKILLYEQVTLIFISIVSLTIFEGNIITYENKNLILEGILNTVLIYSINILLDAGKAVFILIDLIQENKKM